MILPKSSMTSEKQYISLSFYSPKLILSKEGSSIRDSFKVQQRPLIVIFRSANSMKMIKKTRICTPTMSQMMSNKNQNTMKRVQSIIITSNTLLTEDHQDLIGMRKKVMNNSNLNTLIVLKTEEMNRSISLKIK